LEVSILIYPCYEAKRLSGPSERWLREPEEARGELLRITILSGAITAVFPWGSIALPTEMESRLRELVGKNIGILRLEGYHIREV
jgi:hypothetical protein